MISIIGVSLKSFFLTFEYIGSNYWYALALINHGDTSDSKGIDEWDWRSMSDDDDQDDDEYCTVQ